MIEDLSDIFRVEMVGSLDLNCSYLVKSFPRVIETTQPLNILQQCVVLAVPLLFSPSYSCLLPTCSSSSFTSFKPSWLSLKKH